MKPQVMLCMRAHLSQEILPSLGKMYPVLMNEYEHTVFVFLSEGGLYSNEALCWGRDASKKQGCSRCCCFCYSPVVPCMLNLLDFREVVQWSCWAKYCSPSSCMAREKKKKTQSVRMERGAKWLHLVSSSDSFISKLRARQEVPLRGVFNSDLVYSLFCFNKIRYFCVILRLLYEFSWIWSVILHFQMQSSFTCAEIQMKRGAGLRRKCSKLMIN